MEEAISLKKMRYWILYGIKGCLPLFTKCLTSCMELNKMQDLGGAIILKKKIMISVI